MNKGCLGLIAIFICFSISFYVLGFTVNYIGFLAYPLIIGAAIWLGIALTPWFNSLTNSEKPNDNNSQNNNFEDDDDDDDDYYNNSEIDFKSIKNEENEENEENDEDDEDDEDDEPCIPLNKNYKKPKNIFDEDEDEDEDGEGEKSIPLRKD